MTMDKKELTLERGWTLAELMCRFKETFGATLRIFDDRNRRIVNDPRRIEEVGIVTVDSITIRGSVPVGDIETLMQQTFGLKVRIATPNDWRFAPQDMPLYRVYELPTHYYTDAHAMKRKYEETK